MNKKPNNKMPLVLMCVALTSIVMWSLKSYFNPDPNTQGLMIIREMEDRAKKDKIAGSPAHALASEAVNVMNNELDSTKDVHERRRRTAIMFYGFYDMNARVRPIFCKEQGVDIQPFAIAFEKIHRDELVQALSVAAKPEDVEGREINAAARKIITMVMNDTAISLNTTVKGACEIIAAHAEEVASNFQFSKLMPKASEILMAHDKK